jgi:hypothetical protein
MIYSRAPQFIPGVLVESVLLIFLFIFSCCPIMCLCMLISMLWCLLQSRHRNDVQCVLCSQLFLGGFLSYYARFCVCLWFLFLFLLFSFVLVFFAFVCVCLLIVMSNILFYQMSLRSEFCIFVLHNKCSIWNKQYYNKSSLDKILCDIYSMPITVFPLHTGWLDYLQVIIL